MYLVIAETNPLIALFHEGYLAISAEEYATNAKDAQAHLTNTGWSWANLEDKQGLTESEWLERRVWSLQYFEKWLVETGQATSGWLERELYPQMRRIMLHTVLMSRSKFTRYTGFFEIFGVDILLDSDLRAWFIEAVDNPGIHADTAVKKHLFESMIKSTIEMQNALIYEDQALFDDIIDNSMF